MKNFSKWYNVVMKLQILNKKRLVIFGVVIILLIVVAFSIIIYKNECKTTTLVKPILNESSVASTTAEGYKILQTTKYFNLVEKDGKLFSESNNINPKYTEISGADPSSYKLRDQETLVSNDYIFNIAKGGEGVIKVNGADINSYKLAGICDSGEMEATSFYKDKNYLYLKGQKIENSDPESFVLLYDGGLLMAVDKNNVYLGCSVNTEIDRVTFQYLGGGYAKDKNSIWYFSGKFKKAFDITGSPSVWVDFNTFEYVGDGYAKDKNNKYKDVCVANTEDQFTQCIYALTP